LLDRTFFLYRRNFVLFAGIASLPHLFLFVSVAVLALMFGIAIPLSTRNLSHAALPAPAIGVLIIGGTMFMAGSMAVFSCSLGASAVAVSEIYSLRKPAIWASLRVALRKIWKLLAVTLLTLLIVCGGLIFLIIPGIYLGCRLSVAIAAMLIDDVGPGDAIRRSFFLTKGFAGRVFLIMLLVLAVSYAAVGLSQVPFFGLIFLAGKNQPLIIALTILMEIVNLTVSIAIAPISAIALSLYYFDLRIRKEAFDLQKMMQAIGTDSPTPAFSSGESGAIGSDAL
jgi:hypothetical protein